MGILKNAKNLFVRYRNPYISLEKRFVTNEITSKKREAAIDEAHHNPSFVNILKYIDAVGLKKVALLENNITGLLDRFTDDKITEEELKTILNGISSRNKDKLKSISYTDRNKMTITLTDRTIEAERLSHKYPMIAEYHPDILTMETRKGKCHFMSILLAKGLDESNIIATGTIYRTTPRAKYLHSWVEENIDGVDWCYDYTYNLALKKDDYYYLFHAVPYEKIIAKQFTKDSPQIAKLIDKNPIYSKLYLSSRNEALKIASKLPDIDLDYYNMV